MTRSLKKKMYRMAAAIPANIERKEEPAIVTEIKGMRDTIVGKVDALKQELKQRDDEQQTQLDAIDAKLAERHNGGGGGTEHKGIAHEIFEHAEFKRLGENGGRGRAIIPISDWQRKSITNAGVGFATTGVLQQDRLPGIEPIQYRMLRVRDLLRSKPTTGASVDFVKVNTFTNQASMQIEASDKAQSDMTLQAVSEQVRTLAHWVPVSKQCFSDVESLAETINNHLLYGLKLKEEGQLLFGSGSGEDLHGLATQATAFTPSLAGPAWNRLDLIARAIQQAGRSDYEADVVILHTDDFWNLALTKDSQGRYLFGDPGAATIPRIWGRPIAVTNSLSSGFFLVGSSLTALIRDRQEAIIEVSDSHSDYWVKNMLAIRCEERLALQVMKPGAWIWGTLNSSPVS